MTEEGGQGNDGKEGGTGMTEEGGQGNDGRGNEGTLPFDYAQGKL